MMTSMPKLVGEEVIIHQPGIQNFEQPPPYTPPNAPMPMPSGGYQPPNTICPPGLEYLIPLDRIFLQQRIDTWEVVTGVPVQNAYTVVDARGQVIYVIQEESGWLTRVCAGSSRSFKMSIYDRDRRVALLIERPLHFFSDKVTVSNGSVKIGSIKKTVFSCTPEFFVYDENDREILKIGGPLCICGCDVEFTVFGNNGDDIGMIKKHWSGTMRELFTNADVFGVNFPIDLCVKAKALLLAAAILIDFGYFERNH